MDPFTINHIQLRIHNLLEQEHLQEVKCLLKSRKTKDRHFMGTIMLTKDNILIHMMVICKLDSRIKGLC